MFNIRDYFDKYELEDMKIYLWLAIVVIVSSTLCILLLEGGRG